MKGEVEAKGLLPIGLDIQLGIDDVYFKEGDRVKKGDIIIKFSDYKSKDLETKLYNQKQELAVKTSQLRYLQEQYKLGADVTDQIQKLTGEIKALEGELATASKEKSLVQRVVMSPIDGYIVKLNAVKGGTTDSLTPVVILAKTHDIKIVSEPFPANKLQYVNLGNKAEIKAINNSETKFEGILYKISDSGIPDLKVLEFLTSSFADVTLNQILKITDSVWVFIDIKSAGPRDNFEHAVMSPYQISGSGDWNDINKGMINQPIPAQGKRVQHDFLCSLSPIYVLSDKTVAPLASFIIKPIYGMLEEGGQPLEHIKIASIPNGILLTKNPNYLNIHKGLFFPGKDDKEKDLRKIRARIDFNILKGIDNWRVIDVDISRGIIK